MPIFPTENIRLAAAILALLPDTTFELTGTSSHKTFEIKYPSFDEKILEDVVSAFYSRSLTINLGNYNRALSRLRDKLFDAGTFPRGKRFPREGGEL